MTIHVVKPGALSTFQDLGRHGLQHLGIPVNGAMDEFAHRLANVLVENAATEATLEITLLGPTLHFERGAWIAITGADLSPMLDGTPLSLTQPYFVPAGSTLTFGKRQHGMRCYLALQGGFDLPCIMGSRSTFVRGGYGGFGGRPLRKEDTIGMRAHVKSPRPPAAAPAIAVALPPMKALIEGATVVRFTAGRHWSLFGNDAQNAFTETPFRLSSQSDRMAYRTQGLTVNLRTPGEMLSEAVQFGTVQVPSSGQPIVLMADRQTTGGYPKIAQVCSVDLPLLAQCMPGESVRFQRIEHDAAERLLTARQNIFNAWTKEMAVESLTQR